MYATLFDKEYGEKNQGKGLYADCTSWGLIRRGQQ